MTSAPRSVIVLGAGPAGLAAARELSAAGVEVTVLERSPWVGGLSMTVERDGFRFDLGGHRWFTKEEWLDAWFRELMRGELVTVQRTSRIFFGDRFFHYPLRITNVLRELGPLQAMRAAGSFAYDQIRSRPRSRQIETLKEAYLVQFGPVLYEMFFRRYTEKVWGRDCSQLSADWAFQRTKGLSMWDAARNVVAKTPSRVESLVEEFVYPRLGYQRISDRLREDVEASGGRVLLNAKVVGVTVRGASTLVHFRGEDGEEREVEADHAISTIPLGSLAHMLAPAAPSYVIDAAKGLEFRSIVTANVMLDRERVTSDTWLYVHDRRIGFARIHEPKNWSAAMAPPGRTGVCAEWFCTIGDETWKLSDQEIVDRTISHLADDLGFIERREVSGGFAVRARKAYPVYTLDYASRVETLKQHLSAYANRLSIAGRGGTFRYNNADHSIEMGILVARNLLGGDHDVDGVNTKAEYLEEKVVGR